ncbi:MAG: peptidase M23 [Bacteroidetes bacterium HGW-Bacteroidetes-8]|jgi:murein DD-endopeptidase MepM/ murein hydrolase activator NlpD|nr:MAG: peptidase M23 [Bacteroidetes bacterium HGW-Bacteroidetes-8]
MAKQKRYKFNHETLAYEIHKIPIKRRFSKGFVLFMLSLAISVGYYYIYTRYLNLETPKTLSLKRENDELANRLELINRRFESVNRSLVTLQMRDNYVYRPIFGMEEIPQDVRNAGFGGVDRYSHLQNFERSGILSKTAYNLDVLYKKTYVQTKSFDDLALLAKNADEMTLCVPAIPPVNISSSKIRFSSSFGYRRDPFHGDYRMHSGVDLSGPVGETIYATGNGRVVDIGFDFFGYGNFILIDHGFGYKTRYAHLKSANVTIGRAVKRGEQIGIMGNTGRSKGPHLHYEVIYRNKTVNPLNYYNRDINDQQFRELISPKS